MDKALNDLETATFNGTLHSFNIYFEPNIPAEDATRRFRLRPPPAGTEAPAWNQAAGRVLLALLPVARSILRIVRAYARGRYYLDKVPNHMVKQPSPRTDEWYLAELAHHSSPTLHPHQPFPDPAEDLADPSHLLWWAGYVASVPVDLIRRRLEAATRDAAAWYRGRNAELFTAPGVWEVKYSQDAIDRQRAGRSANRAHNDNYRADRTPRGSDAKRARRAARAEARATNANAAAGAGTRVPTATAPSPEVAGPPTTAVPTHNANPNPPPPAVANGNINFPGFRAGGPARGGRIAPQSGQPFRPGGRGAPTGGRGGGRS